MADTQETIADIIAEMRGMGNYQRYSGDHARVLAKRLEAAHKREHGNAAKLREAVGYILKYADSVACRDHDEHTRHYIDQIRKWAQSALAAPPRNCDVYNNESCRMAYHLHGDGLMTMQAFADWLFAPRNGEGRRREVNARDIDLSSIHAVCKDCARMLGFTPKDKAVGVWMDECGVCHLRKPCTDLHHDWNPPKNGGDK